MYKNLNLSFRNIYEISKLLTVKNKKLKIIYSVSLSNAVVFFDLLIIYLLTSFFQPVELPLILKDIDISEVRVFLPVVIFFRFLVIYLDTMNIHNLRLDIEESLRENFLDEIFLRGNYSISDSYFFINTLCVHVSTFYQNFTILLTSIVKISLFSVFLLTTETSIFFYFVLGILFLFIPLRYFTKLNRHYSHISYETSIEISDNVERVIDNLYLIKILNKFKFEKKSFKLNLDNYYNSQINNQKYGTLNSLFPTFITMFFLSVILIFFPISSLITLEFIAIILRLFQSLGEFNRVLSMSISTYVHLENLNKIEQNKEKIYSSNFQVTDAKFPDNNLIELKEIKFKYLNSENLIFDNLSLSIERGKHTIITGPNGIGKSTFLGLVTGVFYANSGRINLYTKKVSYVSAYPMIIRGTLRDNILYGTEKIISDKEIIELLTTFKLFDEANIDLERTVSNKSLSSGQMQKLSFVRALLSKPELLILDESTANLDKKTKALIYNILKNLNITILNSTHSSEDLIDYDKELSFSVKNEKTIIEEVKSNRS